MLTKVLISCALLVAAQADYAPREYRHKPLIGGYAAQYQPAVTLTVLPSHGYGYGHGSSYGHAEGLAYRQGPADYKHSKPNHKAGVDAEALELANLVWALPSAGNPNPAIINVPTYHTTSYSSPAVLVSKGRYNHGRDGHANGASAAAAAAKVAAHIPAPAHADAYKVRPAY